MKTSALAPVLQVAGPFASALVDVSHDSENGEHEHALRVRAVCDRLAEAGAGAGVVDVVSRALLEPADLPAPAARFVIATDAGVCHEAVVGARVDQAQATWGALPDLAPWITHADTTVTFVLAPVDHAGGDVSLHSSALPTALEEESVGAGDQREDDLHKVSVGGWAERRNQLRSENAWRESAEQVVEAITSHVRAGHRLVLLSGDPTSVALVRDRLGEGAEVVEIESGQRAEDGGDEALERAVQHALSAQVVRRRLDQVHEVRARLGRGEGVATGVKDVAEAFVRGQVAHLVLDPAGAADLELDPDRVEGLALGETGAHGPMPADRVLLAAAVLTDAEVTVLPASVLGGAPVAALLRWQQ
ncbi:Vms1/Ankzf1 family peptidyl-tRNA hydrolase [Nocardioides dongxiaopingii]|uniref:baeRF2 domain-containing protein n=1 Tax=Nocardioides dongxiaopingii TaxID=2576036 RepID=UPI0010C76E61|nr:Vms1/Ankzf1 family peptidyl-tRNA hydrolase [Nocardioides dongxiaopingii]